MSRSPVPLHLRVTALCMLASIAGYLTACNNKTGTDKTAPSQTSHASSMGELGPHFPFGPTPPKDWEFVGLNNGHYGYVPLSNCGTLEGGSVVVPLFSATEEFAVLLHDRKTDKFGTVPAHEMVQISDPTHKLAYAPPDCLARTVWRKVEAGSLADSSSRLGNSGHTWVQVDLEIPSSGLYQAITYFNPEVIKDEKTGVEAVALLSVTFRRYLMYYRPKTREFSVSEANVLLGTPTGDLRRFEPMQPGQTEFIVWELIKNKLPSRNDVAD